MTKSIHPFLLRALIAGVSLALLAGCSAESKKNGHLKKGGQYLAAGAYDKAELEYKNVLTLDRANGEAIARLGTMYFDQGRVISSFPFLKKAVAVQPQNNDVRLRLAKGLIGFRQYEEARAVVTPMLEQNPLHEEVPVLVAEGASTPKDIVEARVRLLRLPNQSAGVLTGLATLDLREGKVADAEGLLGKALSLSPTFSPANAILGMVYLSKKDLPQAEKSLVASLVGEPARSLRRVQLAQFYLQTDQIPAARRVLGEALNASSDFVSARILLAEIASREKKYAEGLTLLDRVFAQDQYNLDAMLLAAKIHQAKGDHDKAVTVLESAAKTYDRAAMVHHQLGLAYLEKGEIVKAGSSFAEATTLEPNFAAAIIAQAEVNVRQRNFIPAIASLKQLLQKAEIPEARFLLGNAYRLQGNLDDALATYRRLSAAAPNNAQVHLNTGLVLLQQNQAAAARVSLEKAVTLAGNDLSALELMVGLDLSDKQPAAARKRIDEQIAKTPALAAPHLLLAKVLLAQSDPTGAEAAMRKAIELQPDVMDTYLLLAQLYISRNEQGKALADLKVAAEKNPKDFRALMLSATLRDQQKDYVGARDLYEKALAVNPKIGLALNNLAYLYAEHFGDLDKGLAMAEKAREVMPGSAEATDTLGWLHYKKRNYARAVTLLEASAARLTENPEAVAHLGFASYTVGDEARARTAFESALKLSSAFSGAEEAKKALAVINVDPVKAGTEAKAELEKIIGARPEDSIALAKLGAIYEREGKTDKALAAYEGALKGSPANITAGLNLTRMYRASKETAKALEIANALRKTAPADGRVSALLGQLTFQKGEHLRAYSLLQESARRLPDDADVLLDYGFAAYSVGRVADAESTVRDALEKSPNFPRAPAAKRFLELTTIAAKPATAGAGDTADTALKTDPANVAALIAKAALAESARNVDAARQDYEKALALFPEFTPAKKQLAILYAEKSIDDKKGIELGTAAREMFPSDADLARALGIMAYRTGNFSRAVSLLQESAGTRATDAELMYTLGMAQRQTKDSAGSAKSLQKALDLGLKGDAAKEVRALMTPEKPAK